MFVLGQSLTVAQFSRLVTVCVEAQRVQAFVNSLSVRVERVDHSCLHSFYTLSISRTPSGTAEKVSIYNTGSGAETHAKEHPRFEDDVPQLNGKTRTKLAESVADVRLWEADTKDEMKQRLGPRLYREDSFGQPKQIIKTLLGQGDLANFTAETIHHRDPHK